MLATAIIVFREVLEAALIISIALAATHGVIGRRRWVSGGVAAGLGFAGIVAIFAGSIADMAEGLGQEIFNAGILIAAVAMLAWHNVWMASHARELTVQMKAVGSAIKEGDKPMYILAIVVALAVLREGSEVVLFLYGIAASNDGVADMVLGGVVGLAGGAAIGAALYFSLLRIPTSVMFKVTGWLILLLAAGLMSEASRYLVQADILPSLSMGPVWDTSFILSDHSLLGQTLHTLIGYSARPLGIQIVAYVITLGVILSLMLRVEKQNAAGSAKSFAAIFVAGAMGMALFGAPPNAMAGDKVYSPNVTKSELELEFIGHREKGGSQEHKWEVGYGFSDRWKSAVYLETENKPGDSFEAEAIAWENIIQLTEQGEHWVDVGLYLEYEHAFSSTGHDKIETKLLLEKQFGNILSRFNLILEKEVSGVNQDGVELEYAWQAMYRHDRKFEFGLEGFGGFGELADFKPASAQEHTFGPVVAGKLNIAPMWFFKYELGYQAGISSAATDRVKGIFEVETYF